MSQPLPLHLNVAQFNAVHQRAGAAFKGEMQSLAYAFPEVDVAILDAELRLAFYRIAMSGETQPPPVDEAVEVDVEGTDEFDKVDEAEDEKPGRGNGI